MTIKERMPVHKKAVFFDTTEIIKKGKTRGAVEASRGNYNDLILYFGGRRHLPSSVMRAERVRVSSVVDAPATERSYTKTSPLVQQRAKEKGVSTSEQSKDIKRAKSLQAAFKISGSGAAAGNISSFWQDVGRSMLLLYTKPGDVVVDPFAGHNSRMELCVRAGRSYVGQDLSHTFMRFNRKRAKELQREFSKAEITLYEGDSRKLQMPSHSGDFTITSPPYWDIEEYGNEPAQLGKNDYPGFLEGMQLVLKENYRVLKPGAFSIWFVNDFRKENCFYSYHYDLITLALKAGFLNHDMLIVDLGRGFGDVFLNQYVSQKRLPKRHEYGIVFRKPEVKENPHENKPRKSH